MQLSKQQWLPQRQIFPFNDESMEFTLDELMEALKDCECSPVLDALIQYPELEKYLTNAFSNTPYLHDIAKSRPEILSEFIFTDFEVLYQTIENDVKALCTEQPEQSAFMAGLRYQKKRVAFLCGMADLGGWWNCETVTRTLSKFADASLNAAIDFILIEAAAKNNFSPHDNTKPQISSGLIVLAMGKHGAHELNYSSDIDLILFFDEIAETRVKGTDPTTFFARFARQLIKLLQERTSDGYVFRTDLRLRPDPSSTPPVIPVEAGLIYYESYGQNWERAALIKARPAAGDIEAGHNLLAQLAPFIWRKHLDYAAISDVHSIKRQIHAHKGHADIATLGHNIKLGRGGIREIEFFAQTQQLIAGGRNPNLRTLRTIETLNALRDQNWVEPQVVEELTHAYWYLREVEHRLQMVRDEQTHTLPEEKTEFIRIAAMMGHEDAKSFEAELITVLKTVESHYSNLFEAEPELSAKAGNLVFAGGNDDPQTVETLSGMGFERPKDIIRTIRGWHFGRYPALQNSRARELATELVPSLLVEIGLTPKPDDTLIALDRFISGLPSGIQFFSLLSSNPILLKLLLLILGAAPRLAKIVTNRPHVFDGLLEPSFNVTLPDAETLRSELEQFLSKADDYESMLDRARIFASEQKFLIGARLLSGGIDALSAASAFTLLAQTMIVSILDQVREAFEEKHGRVAGGEICILGMGKLGSSELTAASDLDIILLYQHDIDAEYSDGKSPIASSLYFTRLAQRLITAMSAPTSQGVIYELDFRLRPSGNAGPLATHIDSFFKYQKEKAWTWERQALTRARTIAGSPDMQGSIAHQISKLFDGNKNSQEIKLDICEMRQRIEEEKGGGNPWDVKNISGGLIDIEFIAQWAVLESGNYNSDHSTLKTITKAHDNLISLDQRQAICAAYKTYTGVLQLLGICLDTEFNNETDLPGLREQLCAATAQPDIERAACFLIDTQNQIKEIFAELICQKKSPG